MSVIKVRYSRRIGDVEETWELEGDYFPSLRDGLLKLVEEADRRHESTTDDVPEKI